MTEAEREASLARAKAGKGMETFHRRMAAAYRQVGDHANAERAERMAVSASERFGK